jgi:23S rRNA (guanosine2251-2'-O)-methyltransferase
VIVILDNLRSALNVGSIIRTCDALGIGEVYFCGITPEITNPKVKKTSLGAEKSIIATHFSRTQDAISSIKSSDMQIVSLEVTNNASDVSGYVPAHNFALIVGNEVSGIGNEILELSDKVVMIPMKGHKESLNVSTAFGIAAYVLLKGRQE